MTATVSPQFPGGRSVPRPARPPVPTRSKDNADARSHLVTPHRHRPTPGSVPALTLVEQHAQHIPPAYLPHRKQATQVLGGVLELGVRAWREDRAARRRERWLRAWRWTVRIWVFVQFAFGAVFLGGGA